MNLKIETTVNGEIRQKSNTSQMNLSIVSFDSTLTPPLVRRARALTSLTPHLAPGRAHPPFIARCDFGDGLADPHGLPFALGTARGAFPQARRRGARVGRGLR